MSQPNRTKTALLGFLSWGPLSGYDLRQLIEGSIANFWSEGFGRIYPMLGQLAEEGLATRTETRSEGGRPRHVYQITAEGRDALRAWLAEPTVPRPIRNEHLLKLFFAARTDLSVSREHVEALRSELKDKREHHGEIRARLEGVADPPLDQRFWLMTLRHGELQVESDLQWCGEVLAELDAMSGDLSEDETHPPDGADVNPGSSPEENRP